MQRLFADGAYSSKYSSWEWCDMTEGDKKKKIAVFFGAVPLVCRNAWKSDPR